MAAHKHAEFIKAWADGVTVQVATTNGWQSIGNSPSWSECNEYRIKPAESERVYPVTQMSNDELIAAFHTDTDQLVSEMCGDVANAALRHACDAGQIVTREEFDRAVGDRKARDLAVAHAALEYVNKWLSEDIRLSGLPKIQVRIGDFEFAAIFSKVGK